MMQIKTIGVIFVAVQTALDPFVLGYPGFIFSDGAAS
jgi:hypothetical protein